MSRDSNQTPRSSLLSSFTVKGIVALVYVAIALTATAVASSQTWTNLRWYSTTGNLDVQVSSVDFHFDGGAIGIPYVRVHATVSNPTDFDQLVLKDVNYLVFVNSTSVPFNPTETGSTQVASASAPIEKLLPAKSSLNITWTLFLITQVVGELKNYLSIHNSTTDGVTYVGVTLQFFSTLGTYYVPYCYLLPSNVFAVCPLAYVSPSRGPAAGGG